MKHINTYDNFLNEDRKDLLDEEQLLFLYDIMASGSSFSVNAKKEVHVNGHVFSSGDYVYKQKKGFSGIIFSRVTGDFTIEHANLISIVGFPKYVGGNVELSYNRIEDLSPIKTVNGSLKITGNEKVTHLVGCENLKCEEIIIGKEDVQSIPFIYEKMREQKITYEEVLAIYRDNDLVKKDWDTLKYKPDNEFIEKIRYKYRGKISTQKFGI